MTPIRRRMLSAGAKLGDKHEAREEASRKDMHDRLKEQLDKHYKNDVWKKVKSYARKRAREALEE